NAHATFKKGKSTTSEDPVYELYRNGIVHGSLLNYNNEIVAGKAWNRLFAVADWAKARTKEQQPPNVSLTWGELFRGIAMNAETKKAIEAWQPAAWRLGESGFTDHPAHQTCRAFLDSWRSRNYKSMAELLSASVHNTYGNSTIHQVRTRYAELSLEDFRITEVSVTAPAICEVATELVIEGESVTARLRWVYEDTTGQPRVTPQPGQWRLTIWEPRAYLPPR